MKWVPLSHVLLGRFSPSVKLTTSLGLVIFSNWLSSLSFIVAFGAHFFPFVSIWLAGVYAPFDSFLCVEVQWVDVPLLILVFFLVQSLKAQLEARSAE